MRSFSTSFFVVFLLLVGLSAPVARSAACCISATGNGVGRLRNWEDWAGGLTQGAAYGVGRWDTKGRFHLFDAPFDDDAGFTEQEWRSQAWALYRLSERTQFFTLVPALVTRRSARGVQAVGGGVGDVQAGVRYEVIEIGEYLELPALAFTASFQAPTGRILAHSFEPLGVDATGRGAWVLAFGASIEKTFAPFFVQLNLGVGQPAPLVRENTHQVQWFGTNFNAALVSGWEVFPELLVLYASANASWEAPLTMDLEWVPNSDRTTLGLGAGLSWIFHAHWTLVASVDTGLYADFLGKNTFGATRFSTGIRYGHF
ncbi:MAG: transporter [Deltaproteobacteria bacterium]|nr:transporter [Deltaproteobacteria bacterium]